MTDEYCKLKDIGCKINQFLIEKGPLCDYFDAFEFLIKVKEEARNLDEIITTTRDSSSTSNNVAATSLVNRF